MPVELGLHFQPLGLAHWRDRGLQRLQDMGDLFPGPAQPAIAQAQAGALTSHSPTPSPCLLHFERLLMRHAEARTEVLSQPRDGLIALFAERKSLSPPGGGVDGLVKISLHALLHVVHEVRHAAPRRKLVRPGR